MIERLTQHSIFERQMHFPNNHFWHLSTIFWWCTNGVLQTTMNHIDAMWKNLTIRDTKGIEIYIYIYLTG